MTARYISAIQSAPSGPVLSMVGRNQLSLEARNSRFSLARRAMAAKAHAFGLEHHPMHQVVHRLADEQASGELGAEEVVAIGRRAIGRRDVVGRAGSLNRASVRLIGIKPCIGLECLPRVGWSVRWVAPEVVIGEDVVPAPVGVVVAEPVAPVVAVPAVLGPAALGLEVAGIGAKPEIAAADRRHLSGLDGADPAVAVAVGAIDPAVQSHLEAVQAGAAGSPRQSR